MSQGCRAQADSPQAQRRRRSASVQNRVCLRPPPGADHLLPNTPVTAQTPGCQWAVSFFSSGSMLEIGSAKCHVLDLLVPAHEERVRRGWSRAPMWGGGICERRGSAAETGLRA